MEYDKIIMNLQENKIYRRSELVAMLKAEKQWLNENSYIRLIEKLVK